jgi:hypothetical protein
MISEKSNSVLEIIDKTIETGIKIDAQYDKNRALIKSKQKHIFKGEIPFPQRDVNIRTTLQDFSNPNKEAKL